MEFLLVLIIGLITILCFNYLSSNRDILSPAVVMPIMFLIGTLFVIVNVQNWNIDYSPLSVFYLLSGIFIFSLPLNFAAQKLKPVDEIVKSRRIYIANWKILLAILIDLVIIYLYRKEILSLAAKASFSGQSLQWFIRNSTSYEGSLEFSSAMRLLIRFVDVTAYIFAFTFINNAVYKLFKKGDLLLLLPIFLFIYKTVLTGGRLDILKLVFAMLVQTYILQKTKVGWKKVISGRYVLIGFLGLLVGLPSFYYGLFLVGRTTTRTLLESVSTYVGGPIQHFNQYVQDPIPASKYLGAESFTPILNMLGNIGLLDYKETVHLEFRPLGITIGNVYTFFRRPLHDFGPMGMYLFVFLVGLIFSILYYVKIRSKRRSFLWDVDVMIYSYIFYWIVLSSIEQYSMTVISVFTLIAIVLFYILAIFYWKFTFTPRGFAFRNTDNDIIRETLK